MVWLGCIPLSFQAKRAKVKAESAAGIADRLQSDQSVWAIINDQNNGHLQA